MSRKRTPSIPLQIIEDKKPFSEEAARALAQTHAFVSEEGLAEALNSLAVKWKIRDTAERIEGRNAVARELSKFGRAIKKIDEQTRRLSPAAQWIIEEHLSTWNTDPIESQMKAFYYLWSASKGGKLLEKFPIVSASKPNLSRALCELIATLGKIYEERGGNSKRPHRDKEGDVPTDIGNFIQAACETTTGKSPPLSSIEDVLRASRGV